jgi:hypothetical protein
MFKLCKLTMNSVKKWKQNNCLMQTSEKMWTCQENKKS